MNGKEITDQPEKFGTFGGVFTPCTLTILGVIMFLRFGEVVGQSGTIHAIRIVLIAKVITMLTGLSLSSIATNIRVKGGGAYFLISRSLGVEFGGSIGLVFFLAQAISVAMYVIGFTEAFVDAFGEIGSFRMIATIVNLLVFTSVMIGASWTIKLQYGILGVLIISLGSFYIGAIGDFRLEMLSQNMTSDYSDGSGFFQMFALFFPAVTGIMAGANMSGDLKEPSRSIPNGTLTAVGVTAIVYLSQAFLFAGARPSAELISDNMIIKQISIFAPLITVGVFAATLSSALSSMMGSPRILQALAHDDIFSALKFFDRTSGKNNEPRRAIILTFVISQICIMLGDLNAIAPIITMFFMITYGLINFATFYESIARNPSYRPRFRFSHWITALLGTIGCFGVMFFISPIWAIASIAVMGGIYYYISRGQIRVRWGDARSGFAYERARKSLIRLQQERYHPKNWRPTILALSGNPHTRTHLAIYGHWLEAGHGILTLANVITGELDQFAERRTSQENVLRSFITELDLNAFPAVIIAKNLTLGIEALVQCHGLGAVRPNTILLGWSIDKDRLGDFANLLRTISKLGQSIVVLRTRRDLDDPWMAPFGPIDVWWKGEKNGELMLLFAHLLVQNPAWRGKRIRLLRVIADEAGRDSSIQHLEKLIEDSRINATPRVIVSKEPIIAIQQHSRNSAVVFLGFMPLTEGTEFLEKMNQIVGALENAIFVSSAGDTKLEA